jgi:hypothetical protein
MGRVGIFVAVACHKPWKEHNESLSAFLLECSLKYDIECLQVFGKPLVDAQNQIADRFLKTGKDYLLMIEDDNWGFTLEMLDALIKHNFYVCGMKYYSRHYPFVSMPLDFFQHFEEEDDKQYSMNIVGHPEGGYHTCGLTGFGMTLIRREVFAELEEPYFRVNDPDHKSPRPSYATDQDFCKRLRERGVLPVGCFDYCVSHRGINNETAEEMRAKADGKCSYLARIRMSKRNKELRKAGML